MVVKKQAQRDFAPEYKRAVMGRIRAGESISGLSQELGIARQVLYRWRDVGRAGQPIRRRGCPPRSDTEPQVREQQIAERSVSKTLEDPLTPNLISQDHNPSILQKVVTTPRPSARGGDMLLEV